MKLILVLILGCQVDEQSKGDTPSSVSNNLDTHSAAAPCDEKTKDPLATPTPLSLQQSDAGCTIE